MTIKQYFANGGKWEVECDTSKPYRAMSVNIGFLHAKGKEDEVQFDIQAYDVDELSRLFNEFCKENNFPTNTVMYVTVVQIAETMELLA